MSGESIVWLIICQELTLIELSFSLIRHDPFLPQPPLPVCTYSTSIHVYTDCKIRGIYISISHKPLTVIHIDANTKRHTHWCRNTSKRTNTYSEAWAFDWRCTLANPTTRIKKDTLDTQIRHQLSRWHHSLTLWCNSLVLTELKNGINQTATSKTPGRKFIQTVLDPSLKSLKGSLPSQCRHTIFGQWLPTATLTHCYVRGQETCRRKSRAFPWMSEKSF